MYKITLKVSVSQKKAAKICFCRFITNNLLGLKIVKSIVSKIAKSLSLYIPSEAGATVSALTEELLQMWDEKIFHPLCFLKQVDVRVTSCLHTKSLTVGEGGRNIPTPSTHQHQESRGSEKLRGFLFSHLMRSIRADDTDLA
jgi:hypothetical protein